MCISDAPPINTRNHSSDQNAANQEQNRRAKTPKPLPCDARRKIQMPGIHHGAPFQAISAPIGHIKYTRTIRLGLSGAARKAGAARGAHCALATEAFNRAHEMATILIGSVRTMMLFVIKEQRSIGTFCRILPHSIEPRIHHRPSTIIGRDPRGSYRTLSMSSPASIIPVPAKTTYIYRSFRHTTETDKVPGEDAWGREGGEHPGKQPGGNHHGLCLPRRYKSPGHNERNEYRSL